MNPKEVKNDYAEKDSLQDLTEQEMLDLRGGFVLLGSEFGLTTSLASAEASVSVQA